MGKYGNAAVMAAKLYQDGLATTPNNAWELAIVNFFPFSKSAQAKGCPRGAFLGLCENGNITGIPEGIYCRAEKNKKYALKALDILRKEPHLSQNENKLWCRVMDGERKIQNHQMDVVISICNAGLIQSHQGMAKFQPS